jgi:hypothetical protein
MVTIGHGGMVMFRILRHHVGTSFHRWAVWFFHSIDVAPNVRDPLIAPRRGVSTPSAAT